MIRYTLLLGIATIVVAGCTKSAPEATTPTTQAAPSSKKLVYIPKNTGNPYFEPLTNGVKKAAEENGFEFVTVAPDTADATSQLPLIKDQIQQGVAAIVLSPNSPTALNPVLDEARQKGIAVVTVDCDLTDNETHRDLCVLPTDPEVVGKGQIEMIGSMIGYQGKIAILSATADAPNQNRWIEVMKKTLASDPKYKGMTLVETVYGNDEPQKSLTEAEALLSKYDDLKGIVAPTSVGVAACAQALEGSTKANKPKVTGLGTPSQMKQYVKNGTVTSFALWDPYDEGYVCGYAAVGLVKKTLKAETGAAFTAGGSGDKKVGDKGIIIAGPPLIFTKDNIEKYKF